jgi:lysozyme family protein
MWPKYAAWWDQMTIDRNRNAEFNAEAKFAIAHKEVYQSVTALTGVPYELIAVLHRREGDSDFQTYLGNGQPLIHRTTEVPKGRGPFLGSHAFIDGAVDALKVDLLTDTKDWRLEKELFWCESFNGWGYANRGMPSPYIWGGTSVQRPGKYTADRRFNARVMDPQPGCAPLLAAIAQLDHSVIFTRETAA